MCTHRPVMVNLALTCYMTKVFLCVGTNPTIDALHPLKAVLRILLLTNAQEYVLWSVEHV